MPFLFPYLDRKAIATVDKQREVLLT